MRPSKSTKAAVERPIKLCTAKLKNTELQAVFSDWVLSFHVDESERIDRHLQKLMDHLRSGAQVFKQDARKPRKMWISEWTWSAMRQRNEAKKLVRSTLAALRPCRQSMFFLAWAACVPQTFLKLHGYGDVMYKMNLESWLAKAWAVSSQAFVRSAANATVGVKTDKKNFLDTLA
eukprot:800086-Karenia_brevis.AAC.1